MEINLEKFVPLLKTKFTMEPRLTINSSYCTINKSTLKLLLSQSDLPLTTPTDYIKFKVKINPEGWYIQLIPILANLTDMENFSLFLDKSTYRLNIMSSIRFHHFPKGTYKLVAEKQGIFQFISNSVHQIPTSSSSTFNKPSAKISFEEEPEKLEVGDVVAWAIRHKNGKTLTGMQTGLIHKGRLEADIRKRLKEQQEKEQRP